MNVLVVVLASEQEVVEDLEPAIGECAQRLVVRFAVGAPAVVEGPAPRLSAATCTAPN